MQRIGRRLDRAVHATFAARLRLCLPLIAYEAAGTAVAAVTNDDWSGYITYVFAGALLVVWARTAAIRALRGDKLSTALGAALRRPGQLVFVAVAAAEPFVDDYRDGLASLPLYVIGALVAFVGLLALVDTVSDEVAPMRALAFWLRELCRPSRVAGNLVGAFVVASLLFGVPWVLAGLPIPDSLFFDMLGAIPMGLADTIALVFAVYWRDAVLNDRYGVDMERVLDGAASRERLTRA